MRKTSKKNQQPENEPMEEEGNALASLADALTEMWQRPDAIGSDPFESYIRHCHARICVDSHSFAGRLRRGYRTLLEDTEKQKDLKNDSESKGDSRDIKKPKE
jgi:hypothetical protein